MFKKIQAFVRAGYLLSKKSKRVRSTLKRIFGPRYKKALKVGLGFMMASSLVLGSQSFAVHINSATQEALESVKGVGPSKAKSIISEREKHGAYKSPEDLSERVRGIGEKTVAKMQEAGVTFDASSSKTAEVKKERRSRRTSEKAQVSMGSDGDALAKPKRVTTRAPKTEVSSK